MKFQMKSAALSASIAVGATRVALGVLWLREGLFKYSAHFGRADILLVAEGVKSNSRVPDYFVAFANSVLASWPGLFGILIPLLETLLGIALVLGALSLPAAVASLFMLMTYWSSDQLIAQYPVMGMLSGAVVAWPFAAVRFSATSLLLAALARRQRSEQLVAGSLRQWL